MIVFYWNNVNVKFVGSFSTSEIFAVPCYSEHFQPSTPISGWYLSPLIATTLVEFLLNVSDGRIDQWCRCLPDKHHLHSSVMTVKEIHPFYQQMYFGYIFLE